LKSQGHCLWLFLFDSHYPKSKPVIEITFKYIKSRNAGADTNRRRVRNRCFENAPYLSNLW
ncbi:hypothetical protein, partial [Collinsella stercoris]|uniref:hypothetical protein n=1 Tax=Collinsella stercoris TaxID=147206 RepID=UPI00248D55A4